MLSACLRLSGAWIFSKNSAIWRMIWASWKPILCSIINSKTSSSSATRLAYRDVSLCSSHLRILAKILRKIGCLQRNERGRCRILSDARSYRIVPKKCQLKRCRSTTPPWRLKSLSWISRLRCRIASSKQTSAISRWCLHRQLQRASSIECVRYPLLHALSCWWFQYLDGS